MKVKCNTDELSRLTKGRVYDGVLCSNGMHFLIHMDNGESDTVHKDWFDVVTDTPQIEVGSEWLWEEANETLVVKCVGDKSVFYQWISDGSEGCEEIDDFLKSFQRNPKTVTMYFYDDGIGGIMAYSHKTHAPLLFTKEIEL